MRYYFLMVYGIRASEWPILAWSESHALRIAKADSPKRKLPAGATIEPAE